MANASSKVEQLKWSAGTLPCVSALVDGVRCDATLERGEPVLKATATLSVVARGSDVPASIVEALSKARTEAQEFAADQLADSPKRQPITVVHHDLLASDADD